MSMFSIPAELRVRQQWLFTDPSCGDNKRPHTLGHKFPSYSRGYYSVPAHIDKPSEWLTFEEAVDAAYTFKGHVGFVLTADDPYTCIDFDVTDEESQRRKGQPVDPSKWTHPDAFHWFWSLTKEWDSYAEVSASAKGLHVWIQADIGTGRRRAPIEVYSQQRFIICTGNVVLDRPMRDRQAEIDALVARMDMTSTRLAGVLPDEPETRTDYEVIDRLSRSGQRGKAWELAAGRWQQYGYPSQSEADEALLGLLYGFTRNSAQLKRLFRITELGKRPKAMKDDRYLDRSINSIRQRRAVDLDAMSGLLAAADRAIEIKREADTRVAAARAAIERTLETLRGL